MQNKTFDFSTLSIDEIKNVAKRAFRKRMQGLKSKPILILGHRGIGKTQTADQVAAELSLELTKTVKVFKLDLSFFEAPDLRGRSVTVFKNGRRVTINAPPDELFPLDDDEYGIIAIDEVTRISDQGVRSSLLTLLEEYRISNVKLSKNCFIMCMGNHIVEDKDGNEMYENIQPFDVALSDRVRTVYMTSSPEATFAYLTPMYPKSIILQTFMAHPEWLGYDGTKVSPRTLEAGIVETADVEGEELMLELRTSFCDEMGQIIFREMKKIVDKTMNPQLVDYLNSETAPRSISFLKENWSKGDYTEMLITQAMVQMNEWALATKSPPKETLQLFMEMVLTLPKDKGISLHARTLKVQTKDLFLLTLSQKAGIKDGVSYYKLLTDLATEMTNHKSKKEEAA